MAAVAARHIMLALHKHCYKQNIKALGLMVYLFIEEVSQKQTHISAEI